MQKVVAAPAVLAAEPLAKSEDNNKKINNLLSDLEGEPDSLENIAKATSDAEVLAAVKKTASEVDGVSDAGPDSATKTVGEAMDVEDSSSNDVEMQDLSTTETNEGASVESAKPTVETVKGSTADAVCSSDETAKTAVAPAVVEAKPEGKIALETIKESEDVTDGKKKTVPETVVDKKPKLPEAEKPKVEAAAVVSAVKPEVKTEVKVESKPVSKTDSSKTDSKPTSKPEAKPEAKTETKTETKPLTKPQTKPQTKPEKKPDTKPDSIKKIPTDTEYQDVEKNISSLFNGDEAADLDDQSKHTLTHSDNKSVSGKDVTAKLDTVDKQKKDVRSSLNNGSIDIDGPNAKTCDESAKELVSILEGDKGSSKDTEANDSTASDLKTSSATPIPGTVENKALKNIVKNGSSTPTSGPIQNVYNSTPIQKQFEISSENVSTISASETDKSMREKLEPPSANTSAISKTSDICSSSGTGKLLFIFWHIEPKFECKRSQN